jgi:hypothetical protein
MQSDGNQACIEQRKETKQTSWIVLSGGKQNRRKESAE